MQTAAINLARQPKWDFQRHSALLPTAVAVHGLFAGEVGWSHTPENTTPKSPLPLLTLDPGKSLSVEQSFQDGEWVFLCCVTLQQQPHWCKTVLFFFSQTVASQLIHSLPLPQTHLILFQLNPVSRGSQLDTLDRKRVVHLWTKCVQLSWICESSFSFSFLCLSETVLTWPQSP